MLLYVKELWDLNLGGGRWGDYNINTRCEGLTCLVVLVYRIETRYCSTENGVDNTALQIGGWQ